LNQTDNFTASGELYMDDSKRKDTHRKNNYHRLIYYKVYRNESDVSRKKVIILYSLCEVRKFV